MLVLSRIRGESVAVEIAPGVYGVVTVVDIDRGKVRIGFDFPRSFNIQRTENLRNPHAPASRKADAPARPAEGQRPAEAGGGDHTTPDPEGPDPDLAV